MEIITINDINYILADYILQNAPIYSKSCRSSKELIRKKEIQDYIFARYIDNQWIITEGKSAKFDKVLIQQKIISNIDELNSNINITIDDNGIEKAPNILQLTDDEKFKDNNGNILHIKTIGERKYDKIYFKVKDVSNSFNIVYLNDSITDKNGRYEYDIDYKYFICNQKDNSRRITCNKELYLTYQGMLRVLFVSRNNKTTPFIKWATEVLFTIHLGKSEDQEQLGSQLIGINYKTIKDVFKSNSSNTPCVYLYLINNANNIFKDDTYNENDLLCKFGCTDDLVRRCSEHNNKLNKEFNTNIELICFSIIDPKYIFDAENNINQYFKSNIISYKKMKELIVINKKDLGQIKQHYKMIQNSYIGRYEEMNNKIIQLEKDILELNNNIKLLNEKQKNELLIEKHKNELKQKDIEILEYKLKLL